MKRFPEKRHTWKLEIVRRSQISFSIRWLRVYQVFKYIYSLLIEKGNCDRSNVPVKLPCMPFIQKSLHFFSKIPPCFPFMYGNFNIIFPFENIVQFRIICYPEWIIELLIRYVLVWQGVSKWHWVPSSARVRPCRRPSNHGLHQEAAS